MSEEKLYIINAIKEIAPDVSSATAFRVKSEMYDDLKESVNFQYVGNGAKPRYFVTDLKDKETVKGWILARLTKLASNPRSALILANGSTPTATTTKQEAPQISVRANKAGLTRLIETMRKSGYIIKCKITEPMEDL